MSAPNSKSTMQKCILILAALFQGSAVEADGSLALASSSVLETAGKTAQNRRLTGLEETFEPPATGKCRDDESNEYDMVFNYLPEITGTPENCGTWCMSLPAEGFVGFQAKPGSNNCACLYEMNTLPAAPTAPEDDPYSVGLETQFIGGIGPIDKGDGNQNYRCYKSKCYNDVNFRVKIGRERLPVAQKKPCSWVAAKPNKRCDRKGSGRVRANVACPGACLPACAPTPNHCDTGEDDETWNFVPSRHRPRSAVKPRGCDWVAKRDYRKTQRCDKIGEDGRLASEACCVACSG